ncbi:Uncharacterised protein [Mycobacteroides abscessus subsp. abscessus]|nr:Uncharacterised protein [Mycobacteroides abscessus subsp. abscessus]
MSAARLRSVRLPGHRSCTATDSISPSKGSTPAWLATTRAPPVAGMFSTPVTSTLNQRLNSGLSKGSNSDSLRCSSNPKSSTL